MALRKPKEKNPKNNPPDKNQGSPSMMLMFAMMLAVFMVGAGMVVGYFKYIDPQNGNEAQAETRESAFNSMDLGDMVVNLADPGNHFLKTNITIEYVKDRKMEALITDRKHQVTEVILLTLRKKTVAQVSPPEASEKLKEELIQAINDQLGEEAVQRIYFTQYIVQ